MDADSPGRQGNLLDEGGIDLETAGLVKGSHPEFVLADGSEVADVAPELGEVRNDVERRAPEPGTHWQEVPKELADTQGFHRPTVSLRLWPG